LYFGGDTTKKGFFKEIDDLKNAEKYRSKTTKEQQQQRKLKTPPMEINPSLSQLEQYVEEFMTNLINEEPEKVHRTKFKYDRPNVYKELDPRIRMKVRKHYRDLEDEEKEKPLLIFYYDRSYSFDPEKHKEKTQLGIDL